MTLTLYGGARTRASMPLVSGGKEISYEWQMLDMRNELAASRI